MSQQQQLSSPQRLNEESESATAIAISNATNLSTIISSVSQKWYDIIVCYYTEPHRAYHNLRHVEDVLTSIDILLDTRIGGSSSGSVGGVEESFINRKLFSSSSPDDNNNDFVSKIMEKNKAIFTLAAFFHDVIYNPKSSTNEKDSANLFLEFVSELSRIVATTSSLGIEWSDSISRSILFRPNTMMTQQIEQCIIATATHISSANQARNDGNTIVAIFLDADMSILGRHPSRYDTYAASIRKEYEFVERSVYCEKRAEILASFLPSMQNIDDAMATARSNQKEVASEITEKQHHYYIYATDRGRELWEDYARQNLRREIDMLRRGIIPCEM